MYNRMKYVERRKMMKKRISIAFAAVLAVSMIGISSPVDVNAACNHNWIYVAGNAHTSSNEHTFTCTGHGHYSKSESCTIETIYSYYVKKCTKCGDTENTHLTHTQHTNSHCSQY